MSVLNYHHLRYFHEVAHDGNLTRTARRLRVSQSALSSQIKDLEQRLGHPLFERVGRGLILTEAGRIALDHADRIFMTGQDLLAALEQKGPTSPPLRVGALSTLSRNFQLQFLRPLLSDGQARLSLRSGASASLMEALAALALDVVLTTNPTHSIGARSFVTHRIAEQHVGLHAVPRLVRHESLPAMLANEAFILPTEGSIRSGFISLTARFGVEADIAAEVDDMAMVRLLAREGVGVAIAPSVVFADEIAAGAIATAPFDLPITETFYAVTIERTFAHPALARVLAADQK